MSNQDKLSVILHQMAFFEGQRSSIQKEFDHLKEEVATAKYIDSLQPVVIETLERLQKQEHERSVGVFSKLLSALSKDVLPHLAKPVVLDLYTAHGSPALDIEISAGGKFKEEITSGAMKNVLSVGLRLIAISRTKQRRFLVLDEPDHWIKPENVPQFVNVLDKIIRELGFQILMISHHPNSYFDQVAKCVHLDYDSNGKLNVTGDLEPEEHKGLQAVRLIDFESHVDTIIPLHEGMTVLTGDNGLGKSSFIRGLKSLFHGETHNDRIIRHTPEEAACCRVELKVENNEWVGWRRVRKLNANMRHKNRYYVRKDDISPDDEANYLVAEDTSDSVPDFVRGIVNVQPSDKWDLHLAGQEESVFLINRLTKATERAKILALGNEAQVLHAMIEQNRLDSRKNKEFIRESEKKLGVWLRQLNATIEFEEKIKLPAAKLQQEKDSLDLLEIKKTNAAELLLELKKRRQSLFYWKGFASLSPRIPSIPLLKNTDELKGLCEGLVWSLKWAKVKSLPKLETPPELKNTGELNYLIKSLSAMKEKSNQIKKNIVIPETPLLKNLNELNDIVKQLSLKKAAIVNSKNELNKAQENLIVIEKEIKIGWDGVKNCPLCGQNI